MMPQATLQPTSAAARPAASMFCAFRQKARAGGQGEGHDQAEQHLEQGLGRIEIAMEEASRHAVYSRAWRLAAESETVSQAFQPSGRFWAANSL